MWKCTSYIVSSKYIKSCSHKCDKKWLLTSFQTWQSNLIINYILFALFLHDHSLCKIRLLDSDTGKILIFSLKLLFTYLFPFWYFYVLKYNFPSIHFFPVFIILFRIKRLELLFNDNSVRIWTWNEKKIEF